MRILIVDDNAMCVELMSLICQRAGHETLSACNGRDALARLQSERVDLVLMDVWMPELDGHEAARSLRGMPGGAELPIIFVTAVTQASQLASLKDVKPKDILIKPFSKDQVLASLERALNPTLQ